MVQKNIGALASVWLVNSGDNCREEKLRGGSYLSKRERRGVRQIKCDTEDSEKETTRAKTQNDLRREHSARIFGHLGRTHSSIG